MGKGERGGSPVKEKHLIYGMLLWRGGAVEITLPLDTLFLLQPNWHTVGGEPEGDAHLDKGGEDFAK